MAFERIQVLAVDVGTGTQDILLFDSNKTIENCFKLVMPSPTVMVARKIEALTKTGNDLVLEGVTMGGGPCHWAAMDHLEAGYKVYATPNAARTFDDDLAMVQQMGVVVVSSEEAARLNGVKRVAMRDFDEPAIAAALHHFGVPLEVDALAVAVFDHGAAPPGVSDRLFRFNYIAETVATRPIPSAFAYMREELPPLLTRLQAVAACARRDVPLLLMDTGSAAVVGTLDDPVVRHEKEALLVNIGNFHTLAYHLAGGEIAGIFEHHTGLLDRPKLEKLITELVSGTLTNDAVFGDQGHGALLRPEAGATGKPGIYTMTGPRREMLRGSLLPFYQAVPHGDMMLAGCFGLLRALADRQPDFAPAIAKALAEE